MKLSPASRRTIVNIDGNNICLNEYFIENHINNISYNIFRQRIIKFKERGIVTNKILLDAISMKTDEWRSFYGGGKYKEFIYTGSFYTEYVGIRFHSLSAFLRVINKYNDYQIIKSRLLRNWDIDKAILEKAIDTTIGIIYVIKCKINSMVYVGQTIKTKEERLKEHIRAYESKNDNMSSRLLFKAFDKYGVDNFYIDTLEDNVNNENIADRENYWINKLNSLGTEYGLNMKIGANSCV